jgi:hypothetical protein
MKKANRYRTVFVVITALAFMTASFSGCSSTQKDADFPMVSALSPDTLTAIPSPTEKQTLSAVDFLTATSESPSSTILDKCMEITQSPIPRLQGVLALQRTIRSTLKETMFLNLETGQEKFISKPDGEYFSHETVSPAGTYFAAETFSFSRKEEYPEYHQGPIVIFDSGGNLVAKVDLKQESYGFTWLNENEILMNYPYEDDNPVFLISPFTGTQKKIRPFITDIFYPSDTSFLEWGFYGTHKNVYDPQMTRALYPSSDENGPTVVLRDLEKKIDLASFSTLSIHGNSPTWSLDGEKIAIALNPAPFVSG